MYAKLRVTFVSLAALALLICMTVVITLVYFLSDNVFETQISSLMEVLLDNNGEMPERRIVFKDNMMQITGEIQFETRYFSVTTDAEGRISEINTENILSVDSREAGDIAKEIYGDSKLTGRERLRLKDMMERILKMDSDPDAGRYHYQENVYYYGSRQREDGSTLYVFIDATSRYLMIQQIYSYILIVSGSILLAFTLIFILLSKRVMEPFIKNQERQKRFITNASHELKTPLTVISANTEMIEMTGGKNKWTESNVRQIKNMSALISNLVTLSKLDEKDELVLSEVEASGIIKDQAENFAPVVEGSGKKYETDIADDVKIRSDQRGLQEIASILLDNAAKYCDDGGRVAVSFKPQGKLTKKGTTGAKLVVTNSYKDGEGVDYKKFFERFYREDESHNSKKKGFGIGLSIASELVVKLGARIQVSYDKASKEISFTVIFR